MSSTVYNENVEARAYVRYASQFYTADEQLVFSALEANNGLADVDGAPPMDDPIVVAAIVDGELAFYDRVWDRIWLEHGSEFDIPRCPECDRILKSHLAQQCLWCGHDWH